MKTTENQKENKQALSDRIKSAKDLPTLKSLEKRIALHYHWGTITSKHFAQLDDMIIRRIAKIEASQN